mmetsp:Transcript_95432/g.253586  ORF Transcript_95432/g.253586 Transcript_95432/m.253586 type:complete len:609 (-) Transcript_95432:46-1872(-)
MAKYLLLRLHLLQLLWVPAAFAADSWEQDGAALSHASCLSGDDATECWDETAEALEAGGSDVVACSGSLGSCVQPRRALLQVSQHQLPQLPGQGRPAAAEEDEAHAHVGAVPAKASGASVARAGEVQRGAATAAVTTGAGVLKAQHSAAPGLAPAAVAAPAAQYSAPGSGLPGAALAAAPAARAAGQAPAHGALVKPRLLALAQAHREGADMKPQLLALLQAVSTNAVGATSAVLGFWGVFLLLIFIAVCTAVAATCRRPAHSMASSASAHSPAQSPGQGRRTSEVSVLASNKRGRMPSITGARTPQSPTAATLPGSSEVPRTSRPDPENHYIGTPGTSLIGPVQYMGTPAPSTPLPSVPVAPPPAANPKRFCPQLCPGLVVPRGSECVLAVQPLAPAGPRASASSATVEVLDLRGKPVLRAMVARPLQWPKVESDASSSAPPWTARTAPAVTLRMQQPVSNSGMPVSSSRFFDSSILSIGREGVTPEGRRIMFVYDDKGRLFGRLAKDPTRPRYVMASCRGEGAIYYDGLFRNNAVLIANDQQEQLADAEPCSMAFNPHGKFFRLRVSSGVDVGLMLMGLVSISEMEDAGAGGGDHEARPRVSASGA